MTPRSLVLLLALGSVGAALSVASVPVASAQEPVGLYAAPGLFEVLPVGDVVGDGVTAVTLHVLALKPDGTAFTGLRLKVTASAGVPTGWNELGDGLYSFSYVPPRVAAGQAIQISAKGKTVLRETVSADAAIQVRPPVGTGMSLTANPPAMVLGVDREATLSFTIEGAQGILKPSDLSVKASSGEVQNLTHMGGGKFTARFIAPKVNFPQLAVIAVADRRDPARLFASTVVPLQGKTGYPVRTTPNSTVILRIAGREYGPVQSNAEGAASVPVIVPPGVSEATQVTVDKGVSSEKIIDLRVPETKRLAFVPGFAGVPADGATKVPIRVAVYTADGKPDVAAALNLTATAGSVSAARHEGNGIYVADFTPSLGNSVTVSKLTAALKGSSVQTDAMELKLVPARPGSITLKSQPEDLDAATTAFKVFAKVLGPDGTGMANRDLVFNVAGAAMTPPIQDLKNGDYRADFTTTDKTAVQIVAHVKSPVADNPISRVVVLPMAASITNDGMATNMLTVLSLDEFGYPVPNTAISLQLDAGDGDLPASVTTNANGVGQVFYRSGRKPGVVKVRAIAGPTNGATAFVQAPGAGAAKPLPASGTAAAMRIAGSWRSAVAQVEIAREGATTAAGMTSEPAGPTGVITSVSVRSEPSMIAPGGAVTLRIKAVDGEGRGVGGDKLELMASAGGVFSPLSDLGGGEYQVGLKVPPTTTGEVKVTVASSAGTASSFMKIPVSGEAVASGGTGEGWGETTPTPPTFDPTATPPDGGTGIVPDPGPTDPVKPVKPPKEDGEYPWLRIRASGVGSSYRYEQQPLTAQGPLLPVVLAVGGQNGGPNATPLGLEIAAKGWFEDLEYVGFDLHFRMASYSITAAEFNGAVAPDTLYDVRADIAGRYPFDVSGNRFHVGVRAGFLFNDFIVFKGSFDEGRVEYNTLGLPGLGLSAEVGAEVDKLYLNAGITEGLFYFTQPYSTSVDANVGYQILPNFFADVGFTHVFRQLEVVGSESGAPVGELSDGHTMVKIGVGYSL